MSVFFDFDFIAFPLRSADELLDALFAAADDLVVAVDDLAFAIRVPAPRCST